MDGQKCQKPSPSSPPLTRHEKVCLLKENSLLGGLKDFYFISMTSILKILSHNCVTEKSPIIHSVSVPKSNCI